MNHNKEARKYMSVSDALTGMEIIRKTAAHFGQPEEEVRQDMQAMLDAAWDTDDPEAKAVQMELFPNGKPCIEDFILTIACHLKN